MKRFLTVVLICALLAGCTAAADRNEPTVLPIIETDPPAAAQTELPTVPETEPPVTQPPMMLTYQIYLPNDNADGFVVETVETPQITADSVLKELQNRNVLPDTVAINAFGSEGTQLNIDFNRPFADLICSMGTSGELMITGSVVNTYLSAFQADSVYFTVNGEILESGHVVYDFPLTFVE